VIKSDQLQKLARGSHYRNATFHVDEKMMNSKQSKPYGDGGIEVDGGKNFL